MRVNFGKAVPLFLSRAYSDRQTYRLSIMGCCLSAEEQERKKKNDEIEEQLKQEKLNASKEVKMLLLGT